MSTDNDEAVSSLSSNSREASPPTGVFAKYIIIMIAVSAIVVLFGVKPMLEGFFGNNEGIEQQKTVNASNQKTFDELIAKQANLSETETQVNEFLTSFPSSADQQTMFAELSAIASKNGVTIESMSPSIAGQSGASSNGRAPKAADKAAPAAGASDLVAAINLDLSVSGGNPNQFLADLEKAQRVFVIESLSYTGEGDSKSMTLKATTFVVSPLVDPNVAPVITSPDELPALEGDVLPAPEGEAIPVPEGEAVVVDPPAAGQ